MLIIPSALNLSNCSQETIAAHVLHAVKPHQSSHHSNRGGEVSCYRDGKRLGPLSATVLCVRISVRALECVFTVCGRGMELTTERRILM